MTSPSQKINQLQTDRSHGAAELARLAVAILEEASSRTKAETPEGVKDDLRKLAKKIVSARPSMNAVRTSVILALDRIRNKSSRKEILKKLEKFQSELIASFEKSAKNASKLLKNGVTVLTNSFSSTFLKAAAFAGRRKVHFIVAESRPLFEGRRTAKELAEMGFKVTLISDAACSIFIEQSDLVLVGADTILPDGSLANKVGTKLIALAAYEKRISFYAVSQTIKIIPDKKHFAIEEKEPAEISKPIREVTTRNPYFDVTPAKYITGIITENGIMDARKIKEFARQLRKISV